MACLTLAPPQLVSERKPVAPTPLSKGLDCSPLTLDSFHRPSLSSVYDSHCHLLRLGPRCQTLLRLSMYCGQERREVITTFYLSPQEANCLKSVGQFPTSETYGFQGEEFMLPGGSHHGEFEGTSCLSPKHFCMKTWTYRHRTMERRQEWEAVCRNGR